MKLDGEKGKPRFPWTKKRKDRKESYEHLTRVGQLSMVQIGEDEFRTPNRRERRSAGIRKQKGNALYVGPLEPLPALSDADRRRKARAERSAA